MRLRRVSGPTRVRMPFFAIPERGKVRLTEALDRLIKLYTERNMPDKVKKWQAERAKYPAAQPPPPGEKK